MRATLVQRSLSFMALLALIAPPVWGQDDGAVPNPDRPLKPDVLAEWVLQRNAGLAAAEAAADAAAYRIGPAGSLDDPTLNLGAAPRSSEQNIDFSQRIPWPGTLKAREAAARSEASAADWSAGFERLALAAAAKEAYAEWYFITRALEVHHEVQGLLEELIAAAEARYAAGRAPQQDVLQAEVESAELETEELRLMSQQTAALARINGLLNRAPDSPLPPAGSIRVEMPALDARALERLALERHPELKRLGAEIAAADNRVTIARKSFFPAFEVHAGYNGLWEDADKRASLGVSINIPFDRGKRRADLDGAQAERRHAESTLRDERAQLLAQVARARAEVLEAVEVVEIHEEELVPLARAYLDAAVTDYQSGTGAFLNVITAEQRLLTTELALERARADYLRRIADLERLTGGRLETVQATGRQGERQ